MSSFTPWSYRKGSSLLHRTPAGAKLIFLLALSLAPFIPWTGIFVFVIPGIIAIFLITLSIIAGFSPDMLLRGSGPLFIVVIGVFIFQALEFSPLGLNLQGLMESIIFCARLGLAFAAGALLFAVTTPGEIRKSLSKAENALHLEKLNLSLSISLMLGFLPRFFEVWENLNLAWKSRGGKNTPRRITVLVPLAVERMMVKAAETAEAMEARGKTN